MIPDLRVICPVCEQDIFRLEQEPLIGEPFRVSLFHAMEGITFFLTKRAQCPICWAFIMIPKNGGYKVLTNKGLKP